MQGAPAELSTAEIEELVGHAVGVNRERGDSVAVLILPGISAADDTPGPTVAVERESAAAATGRPQPNDQLLSSVGIGWLIAIAVALIAVIAFWIRERRMRLASSSNVDDAAIAAKVRQWLAQGASNGRA
jgi:flagellar biosynthesis/type III secretory pathway M-ring protein FliF/YscJ